MEAYYINNFDFAKRQLALTGEIALTKMLRLSSMLAKPANTADAGRLYFKLTGQSQRFHSPSLHMDIEADLPMLCQRCLEPMLVPITLHFDYVISEDETAALEINDDLDWVEPAETMDVQALIEDELLIALPIAPVHPIQCKSLVMESGEKPNPFSVLKTLKKEQ